MSAPKMDVPGNRPGNVGDMIPFSVQLGGARLQGTHIGGHPHPGIKYKYAEAGTKDNLE